MTANQLDGHRRVGGRPMATPPWIVCDELWELIALLLPAHPRRFRYPGRRRLPDRPALCGILFVLHTGIAWRHLPPQLGFGSGITCRLKPRASQKGGTATGPSPVDDGRPGSKHHLLVEAGGLPLACLLTRASATVRRLAHVHQALAHVHHAVVLVAPVQLIDVAASLPEDDVQGVVRVTDQRQVRLSPLAVDVAPLPHIGRASREARCGTRPP